MLLRDIINQIPERADTLKLIDVACRKNDFQR